MRAKFIYEKFTENSDPIHDLGIGIDTIRNFQNEDEIVNFLIEFIPYILHTNDVPDDIVKDSMHLLKKEYILILNDYIQNYIRLHNRKINVNIRYEIYTRIKHYFLDRGYLKYEIED